MLTKRTMQIGDRHVKVEGGAQAVAQYVANVVRTPPDQRTPLLLPTMNEEPQMMNNPAYDGHGVWPPPREYAPEPGPGDPQPFPRMFKDNPPGPNTSYGSLYSAPADLAAPAPLPLPSMAPSGDDGAAPPPAPVPVANGAGRRTPLPLPSMNP